MRQFQTASEGKWTGDQHGGVKALEALILPDPATRFARTAARLDFLSTGHPIGAWLSFMARLAAVQHAVAAALEPFAAPDKAAVAQAVEARLPPLAADGHRRDPRWRDGLVLVLEGANDRTIPAPARLAIEVLREGGAERVEFLADDLLRGRVDIADAGAALYVAAALQVYFTRLAASLPGPELRLLLQRGLCPCCGSTPVSGVITGSGTTRGPRYLYCSLCSTAWNHVRAVCITCGQSRSMALKAIEGESGAVKAECCDECHTYAKMLYQVHDPKLDPFADDLASLDLDLMVAEAGWSRHAPNPLLLIGSADGRAT